jgi:dihydropteroate synthase
MRSRLLSVTDCADARHVLKAVGVYPPAVDIMAPKLIHVNILVENVAPKLAIILKQDMLARGGDVATHRGVVDLDGESHDLLLSGTVKQMRALAEGLRRQYFGAPELGGEILSILDDLSAPSSERSWTVAGKRVPLRGPLVMGVLNVTPDSFYEGSRRASPGAAVEHALKLLDDGADILDVGGESTRPGADPVPLGEELGRIMPVIEKVLPRLKRHKKSASKRGEWAHPLISVDTYKADVAKEALAAGVHIVNDISGLRADAKMPALLSKSACGYILMHIKGTPRTMQKNPTYKNVLSEIFVYLHDGVARLARSGVAAERVAIDPGIGFGKRVEDNLRIIRHIEFFRSIGRPVVVGASRKSFIGSVVGEDPEKRLAGSLSVAAWLALSGVDVVRTHDVKETRDVLAMVRALRGATYSGSEEGDAGG